MTRERAALREAWASERRAAQEARGRGDAAGEWRHLERAHILSQPMAGAHVRTHVWMLGFAIRRHDRHEVVGQLGRLDRRRSWLVDEAVSSWQHRRRERQRVRAHAHSQ